jgi:hypothetical protein
VAGDAGGLPLSVIVSAANANDSTMFEAVLDDIPPIRMPTGHRHRRPAKIHADKAVRSSPLPRLPVPARDQASDRPPQHRVIPTAGPLLVDDRAHRGMAGRVAAAADPL